MKLTNYNKLFAAGLLVVFFMSSCVKNRPGETDFSNLKPIALIPEGGLAAFGSQALTYPGTDVSDTFFFRVNWAATNVAPKTESFTLGVDQSALAAYNSANPGTPYVIFPDSIYSFTTTSTTVAQGQNYSATIPVVVYPDKVDPTQNFMLPISIMAAPSGTTISTNFGTVYLHFIGNPIAGAYSWDFERWNAGDSTGSLYTSFYGQPTVLAPDNPTQVEVSTGYYTQPRYVISFTNNGGTLSNFQVSFNTADIATAEGAAGGVLAFSSINILDADPINHRYVFQYTVTNTSSGAMRYLIDRFYK